MIRCASLRHELDGYLPRPDPESRHEPPLVLVQREPMLVSEGIARPLCSADYIGEDKLNLA